MRNTSARRLQVAGVVLGLAVVLSRPLSADEWDSCPDLPLDAIPADFRVLPVRVGRSGGSMPGPELHEPTGEFADIMLFDGMLIESEANYREVVGAESADVDWETSRILVVEEFSSYKLGSLDSDVRLSGVYLSGDSLIISQTSTNYGPCQGIAQDPSWFSFDTTYLLLVLPRGPEHIVYHWCSIGRCPPDIP
jgi:hypothetical protein